MTGSGSEDFDAFHVAAAHRVVLYVYAACGGTRGQETDLQALLPDDPAEAKVRVIAGGGAGMADKALTELCNRRISVTAGPSWQAGELNGDVALMYGPAAIRDATLLRAYFPGAVAMIFDPSRDADVISLTVGPGLTSLHTTTEINQFLIQEGKPAAPLQCASFIQLAPSGK